ncbi:RpiB/LacA/LacB family sugar-phosphate isomerase, partial [Candidatus Saccharibacteria bacterium]|nr:RpiB/LacA/LacB family sugar-phosphate isomerase [Candidatus Saccharibacteria bacterium]
MADMTGFDGTKIQVLDAGPEVLDNNDDFVDYARRAVMLANAAKRESQVREVPALLILVCRSGVGMSIAVNRFDGYRGAIVWDEDGAFSSRNDNDANALCLPARIMDTDWFLAQRIIDKWLTTPFSGEERYRRRNVRLDRIREGVI